MSKKILITGSSGFIASNFINSCNRKKYHIVGIDLVKPKYKFLRNFEFIKFDIAKKNNFKLLKKKKFDYVIHLAAFSKPSKAEKFSQKAINSNILGTKNIFDYVKEFSKNSKIFFFSGGALYNSTPKYLPMDENHPIDPYQNIYCFTKRSGENLCEDYIKHYNLKIIYFRLFNTFGPHQDEEFLIPSWIKKCKRKTNKLEILNGSIIRDFNYVENLINLLFMLMKNNKLNGGPFNVGSGKPVKLIDIANFIANYFGMQVKDLKNKNTFGSKKQFSSIQKIKNFSGWKPEISLRDGLIKTIKFYTK